MKTEKYVAFLRGINVGGHHKVPMAELRKEMEKMKFENVVSILNSGNMIFDTSPMDVEKLEVKIADRLEKVFGFPIPTIIRSAETITHFMLNPPFQDIEITEDIRCYVSFLWKDRKTEMVFPWVSEDEELKIIGIKDGSVFSMVDLSKGKTTGGMNSLEKCFGTTITTRSWNTIKRIGDVLKNRRENRV